MVDAQCLKKRPNLIHDQACLDIENLFSNDISIYGQVAECESCNFMKLATVNGTSKLSLLTKSKFTTQMYYKNTDGTFCEWSQVLLEHYRYGWNISGTCEKPFVKESAPSAYIPVICAIIFFILVKIIWYLVERLYDSCSNLNIWKRYILWLNSVVPKQELSNPSSEPIIIESEHISTNRSVQRIRSIDVFRGCSIVLMIFSNYGGGGYWFFQHYLWNGFTVADAIMPWFTWIMGMSLSISISRKIHSKVPRRILYHAVFRRSAILILLGILHNAFGTHGYLRTVRFPGVLQRLGFDYLVVGLLEVTFAERASLKFKSPGVMTLFGDVLPSYPQWMCVLLLASLNLCLTFLMPVPGEGCHAGYVGAGGLHDHGRHSTCTGGAAGYIDRVMFGQHMLNLNFMSTYKTPVYFDSQNILGTLNSILLVYFGVQAGKTLLYYKCPRRTLLRWFTWGIITCLFSGILSNFSMTENAFIPINRNLMSLTFVLLLAGVSFFIQALLYIAVDITNIWSGQPLFYPGMNSILLYILQKIFSGSLPFAWSPEIKTHASYLCMNIWSTILWLLVSIYLYKRKIFISI